MEKSELYRKSEGALGPYLIAKNFQRGRPAEFLRVVSGGLDRIIVSEGPPSKARSHFAVFMSFYPEYLNPVKELIDFQGQPEGFPCGPYLNPVSVSRRPKYWSYKTSEILDTSLRHVLKCLEQVGLPWLESLRDPQTFAANVDPMAPLDAAFAHEFAGDKKKARTFYEEIMRRLLAAINASGEKLALNRYHKEFIYVAIKLNVEHERRERLQKQINYYPTVHPC